MIDQFKQFFDQFINPTIKERQGGLEQRQQIAVAALLIEMTRADGEVKTEEQATVSRALQQAFDISEDEITELIRLAEQEAHDAACYHQFTSLINEHFSKEQKSQLVELLWEVAFADAEMEMYEEHLVRKLADLLYVPHSDFIRAKHRVQERLGLM